MLRLLPIKVYPKSLIHTMATVNIGSRLAVTANIAFVSFNKMLNSVDHDLTAPQEHSDHDGHCLSRLPVNIYRLITVDDQQRPETLGCNGNCDNRSNKIWPLLTRTKKKKKSRESNQT